MRAPASHRGPGQGREPLWLWIDDVRPAPGPEWTWARSSREALDVLAPHAGARAGVVVSFDHDLGGEDTTRPVVLWMIEHGCRFDSYRVHSANPVGREWLVGMIDRYLPGID